MSIGFHTVDIAAAVNGSSVQSGRSNRLLLLVVRPIQERSQRSARIDAASTILTSDDVRLYGHADRDRTRRPGRSGVHARRRHDCRGARRPASRGPRWPTDVCARVARVRAPSPQRDQLLAVAVDTDFARTHFVYAIYTTTSAQSTLVFSLVRFRETANTFTDRIVIADDVPAAPDGASGSVAVRTGRQALCGIRRRWEPASRLRLVVLQRKGPAIERGWHARLVDQRGYVPLYSAGYRSPRGLAWHVPSNTLWVVTQEAGRGRLNAIVSDDVQRRGPVQTTFALPAGTVPSGLAVYPNTGVVEAFRGNLLVASDEGRSLLRLRTDPLMPARIRPPNSCFRIESAASELQSSAPTARFTSRPRTRSGDSRRSRGAATGHRRDACMRPGHVPPMVTDTRTTRRRRSRQWASVLRWSAWRWRWLAGAVPAAAQGPGRVEVGASLVNLMVLIPQAGDKSVLFGFRRAVPGC